MSDNGLLEEWTRNMPFHEACTVIFECFDDVSSGLASLIYEAQLEKDVATRERWISILRYFDGLKRDVADVPVS